MEITISINDTKHLFKKGTKLSEVVKQLDIQNNGVAIAIQNTIIEKRFWSETEVKDQDNILIIQATQGG